MGALTEEETRTFLDNLDATAAARQREYDREFELSQQKALEKRLNIDEKTLLIDVPCPEIDQKFEEVLDKVRETPMADATELSGRWQNVKVDSPEALERFAVEGGVPRRASREARAGRDAPGVRVYRWKRRISHHRMRRSFSG